MSAVDFTILKTRTILANKTHAKQYLEIAPLPGERAPRPGKIERYRQQMDSGQWLHSDIATVRVRDTKTTYKLNGQHTMHALFGAVTGTKIRMTWTDYEVATLRDASVLYAKFDQPDASRRQNEVLAAYLKSTGRADWNVRQAALIVGALAFHQLGRDFQFSSIMPRDDRNILLERYSEEADVLVDILGARNQAPHIQRQSVISAMAETVRVSVPAAREFWRQVRDGENLSKADPAYALRDRLMRVGVYDAKAFGTKTKALNPDIFAWCIRAWNAYRNRQSMTCLKGRVNGALPVAI